jgi:hypothetical protein
LIVDFKSISGSVAPEFLHILLFTDQPFVFESTLSPIPLGGAFSAVLPFSQFGLRGGGPFPINFTQVEEIDVGLFVARDLTDYSNHSWSAAIDRIRVGTVPEPEGMYWLFFTLLVPFPLSSSKLMRMPNTNIAPGWNPNLTHSQIDDNPMVQQRILLRLGQRLLNR